MPWYERQFYISSQIHDAQQLLADTIGHWGIENRLHWVRDVTFSEDFPPRRGGNAPVNWAILHNFFITIARFFGFRTIPQAQRALSNQLAQVFSLFVRNHPASLVGKGENSKPLSFRREVWREVSRSVNSQVDNDSSWS